MRTFWLIDTANVQLEKTWVNHPQLGVMPVTVAQAAHRQLGYINIPPLPYEPGTIYITLSAYNALREEGMQIEAWIIGQLEAITRNDFDELIALVTVCCYGKDSSELMVMVNAGTKTTIMLPEEM